MAEKRRIYRRNRNFWSKNTGIDRDRDINKSWKHDMFEVMERQNAELKPQSRKHEIQIGTHRIVKEHAMKEIWKHDMFEALEREIQQSNENIQPVELFLSNLHHDISETNILDLFSMIGTLRKLCMHYDISGRPLGTAIIRFERKLDAVEAMKMYNGHVLKGMPLEIELLSHSTENRTCSNDITNRRYSRDGGVISSANVENVNTTTKRSTEDFVNIVGCFKNLKID